MMPSWKPFSSSGPQSFGWANVSLRLEELYPHEQKPVSEGGYICDCQDTARVIEGKTFRLVKAQHVHWDQVAFNHGPSPLCVSGGFGAAKTYIACLKLLYLGDTYPNNRVVIARKVAKELSLT